MSSAEQPEPPEVQRNGFEEVLEAIGASPEAVDSFFEDGHPKGFDPNKTFTENVQNFKEYMNDVYSTVNGIDEDALAEMGE